MRSWRSFPTGCVKVLPPELLAGEKRYRIWCLYLAGCAYAFAHNWINVYQVLACKHGGPAANPLPLTRDYMYR